MPVNPQKEIRFERSSVVLKSNQIRDANHNLKKDYPQLAITDLTEKEKRKCVPKLLRPQSTINRYNGFD